MDFSCLCVFVTKKGSLHQHYRVCQSRDKQRQGEKRGTDVSSAAFLINLLINLWRAAAPCPAASGAEGGRGRKSEITLEINGILRNNLTY